MALFRSFLDTRRLIVTGFATATTPISTTTTLLRIRTSIMDTAIDEEACRGNDPELI